MLRVLEITVIIAIVVYGIIKLIEMFSLGKTKRRETSLKKMSQKAKELVKEKEKILDEVDKNKKTIDDINNTLNN